VQLTQPPVEKVAKLLFRTLHHFSVGGVEAFQKLIKFLFPTLSFHFGGFIFDIKSFQFFFGATLPMNFFMNKFSRLKSIFSSSSFVSVRAQWS